MNKMKFYVASFNHWEVVEADHALGAIKKTERIFKNVGKKGEEVLTVRRATHSEIAEVELRNAQEEEKQ